MTSLPDSRLDTLRSIATPEGCELTLRLAGPVSRARAWLFDATIRWIVMAFAFMTFSYLGKFGLGLAILIYFAVSNLYPVLFEVFWHGQTPGKWFIGLRVLHDDGTPVRLGSSVLRNLLRFVDALPVGYALGLVSQWINQDGKRLGDILAGTVVVYHGKRADAVKNHVEAEAYEGPVINLSFPLTVQEQQALLEFDRRSSGLTSERREELALLAEPLTDGLSGPAASQRLRGIAAAIHG